jgi:hypothetical protein
MDVVKEMGVVLFSGADTLSTLEPPFIFPGYGKVECTVRGEIKKEEDELRGHGRQYSTSSSYIMVLS